METSLTILCAWVFADFITGLAHWAQDRVLVESKSKFWNQVIADNVLHHSNPSAMLGFSVLENIRIAVFVMWPLSLFLFLIGAPVVIWLAVFFAAFGNGVHWFSHQRKVNPLIKALQTIGIFASFDHHKQHHAIKGRLVDREFSVDKYCVMTNWVNPVLDSMDFFKRLERVFKIPRPGEQGLERNSPFG